MEAFITRIVDLGLPIWVLVVIALVATAKYVGLLEFIFGQSKDFQEHTQAIQLEKAKYKSLQDSWESDRFASFLENSIQFLQEQIWKKLENIEDELQSGLKKQEMTIAQTRDTLTTIYMELSKLHDEMEDISQSKNT